MKTKRVIELILSSILLILFIPIFILIILAIKIDTKGPAFFKQKRLGKNGKEFLIYKFRTMIANAEIQGTGIFTSETDPRITKVGHFLRKTSLDELPQLINVLKGEMSFVGPRPPVPYHPYKYSDYTDEQKLRFKVLPGITGYAQTKGRNNLSWDERIKLDVWYVRNFSLWLDCKLLMITVLQVLKREKIYPEDHNETKSGSS